MTVLQLGDYRFKWIDPAQHRWWDDFARNRSNRGESSKSWQKGKFRQKRMALSRPATASARYLPNQAVFAHSWPMTISFDPGIAAFPQATACVSFHRSELSLILSVYGRMVAMGEWRDYGISHLPDAAIFSIFRRTAEHPLYRIEKRPKLAARQGQYSVIAMDGRILKRGADLRSVIRVLEKMLIRAV